MDDNDRCGGTGMVAYWDGSAYSGEMCRGCVDCEGPDEPIEQPPSVDAVDPSVSDPGTPSTRVNEKD